MSKTLGLALVLSIGAIAAPASAESVHVNTSDLDLSTDAGNKMLDRRIAQAARKICGANEIPTGTRVPSKSSGECVRRIVGETRQRLAANKAASTS